MRKDDCPVLLRPLLSDASIFAATLAWTLFSSVGCGGAREPAGTVIELSAATLRVADTERLLPGRYDFRVLKGWMVRCDTAKGTCCAMENLSDERYPAAFMKLGKESADAALPGGGGACKD